MARISLPAREDMSAAQRSVYDSVVSGPRGVVVGPLRAAIHNPELAQRWSALGEVLRFRTTLPKRLSELAILVTGRRWTSQIEFLIHARAAADAGLAESIIEAIRTAHSPALDRQAFEVYEFARDLQETGQVPLAAYRAIVAQWGERGVVELTALVGYYTMVSMTLNAHDIPLPDGELPALATLPGPALPTLPPATLLIAIRVRFPPIAKSNLVMRTLDDSTQCLVARPLVPQALTSPAGLVGLPSLGQGPAHQVHQWTMQHGDGRTATVPYDPRLVSDDMSLLRAAALEGLGLCSFRRI